MVFELCSVQRVVTFMFSACSFLWDWSLCFWPFSQLITFLPDSFLLLAWVHHNSRPPSLKCHILFNGNIQSLGCSHHLNPQIYTSSLYQNDVYRAFTLYALPAHCPLRSPTPQAQPFSCSCTSFNSWNRGECSNSLLHSSSGKEKRKGWRKLMWHPISKAFTLCAVLCYLECQE